MRTLHISGKRWFQKTYGNTYYSARAVLDGELVAYTDYAYGYGDQYLQDTLEKAIKNARLDPLKRYDNGGSEAYWQWAERNHIKLTYEASDVARKRDL